VCQAALPLLTGLQEAIDGASVPADDLRAGHAWCTAFASALETALDGSRRLLRDYQRLAERAEALFEAMDFEFLFDEQREVFYIGYNVDAGRIDSHHYDLLTSEARTASLVTIARDEIPQRHWLHLGRPLSLIQGERALLSWSGTMFEYLMPTLFVRQFEGTLLDQSCRLAVEHQIAYARTQNVPWGISESGYYRFDANMNYQYQAFGAPGLGFSRGLAENLVITPYASFLALPIRPDAVMSNITHLRRLGMLGRYGFYEAIDYTPARMPAGQRHAVVQSYMAHHQAMILVPLANYLAGDQIVRRFHADPRVQSVELLLQEQVPQRAPLEQTLLGEEPVVRPDQPQVTAESWSRPVNSPLPEAHVLSNGSYSVLITSAGTGYSRWRDIELTRWRSDTTLDDTGTWIYIRDEDDGDLWSLAHQPLPGQPEMQEAVFHPHMAEIKRRQKDISSQLDVTVSLEDDVEIRRVRLSNGSDHARHLGITSYAEVAIGPHGDDERHPAFSKLFIESEYLPEVNGLLFRRRPRSAEQEPIYMIHLLTTEENDSSVMTTYEGDRMRFLGRGGTARRPHALLSADGALSGTTGATLDPVMALSQKVELGPHASARLAYVTVAARTRQEALQLAEKYHNWPSIDRTFSQGRQRIEIEMRQSELETTDIARMQQLLSALIYPSPELRAPVSTLAANTRGQPSLWPYAISGDYPILLVVIESAEEAPIVQDALQAYAYWRKRQVKIDLAILNRRESGYSQELQGQLRRLVSRVGEESWINDRGGVFLLQADQMEPADLTLLETAARVILNAEKGSLAQQIESLTRRPQRLPAFEPMRSGSDVQPTPPLPRPDDLLYDNGWGGFSADGSEYVIYLEPGRWTPAPWVNVVANQHLGFLVSESGASYTWAMNSGENRLTPWHNDPVSDPPDEAIYLRDEETGDVWSPTPLPAREDAPYLVRHGAGYSDFEHHSHALKQHTRMYVAPDEPVKIVRLRLENTADWTRRITATFYASWVLYTTHEASQMYVVPEYDRERHALLAKNPFNTEFGDRVAFVATDRPLHGLTTDRQEFLGRMGHRSQPAALYRIGLEGRVEAGVDPCAVIQVHLDLPPGQVEEVHFIIGQGADREDALRLVEQYQTDEGVETAWEQTRRLWDDLLGTLQVETPDRGMDLLLNRWMLYQSLSCRIWGRSGFYQSSGAYGFRDQLQDVMSLAHVAPHITREQIVRAAAHQFEEGDVLHWWHPPSGRGVRTRISDDLLWLPYVTEHYIRTTGDWAILDIEIPYLHGEPLHKDEEDRYNHYPISKSRGTLYEHCLRAIRRGDTSGPHDLPLIGGGDWNDGMNRVGIHGRGESIWLGWFLHSVLTRFAGICRERGDDDEATALLRRADALRDALDAHGWDGDWYLRAYYDDGTPLGSAQNQECRIDAIAQSWSVLSGAGEPERARQAMAAVSRHLVRADDGIILLFTPPLDKTPHDPGYIKGYLPGVRENGGQYTHAAIWTVWAYAEMGDHDRAMALYRMINPIYRGDSADKARRYQVEPYVVAADVYGVPPHVGRGGWTWYTGSAAWLYRLGMEGILGLRRLDDVLRVDPRIPDEWPGYRAVYRHGSSRYEINVENPHREANGTRRGVCEVTLDGQPLEGPEIPLVDDGEIHQVRVVLGEVE
jgi:cyclic beta-1,2-glucan synthetase